MIFHVLQYICSFGQLFIQNSETFLMSPIVPTWTDIHSTALFHHSWSYVFIHETKCSIIRRNYNKTPIENNNEIKTKSSGSKNIIITKTKTIVTSN